MVKDGLKFKEGYKVAGCCSPRPNTPIIGYFSHNKVVVVHKSSCENLKKIEYGRLFSLSWEEILEDRKEEIEGDYHRLDELDFQILKHHREMGVDYSLMVAAILDIEPEQIFEHHRKLKNLKLLKRVEQAMIRYRKNIVDNKWIKHRNHTYYQLTPKGERYLDFYVSQDADEK
jgi:hypothetical protein